MEKCKIVFFFDDHLDKSQELVLLNSLQLFKELDYKSINFELPYDQASNIAGANDFLNQLQYNGYIIIEQIYEDLLAGKFTDEIVKNKLNSIADLHFKQIEERKELINLINSLTSYNIKYNAIDNNGYDGTHSSAFPTHGDLKPEDKIQIRNNFMTNMLDKNCQETHTGQIMYVGLGHFEMADLLKAKGYDEISFIYISDEKVQPIEIINYFKVELNKDISEVINQTHLFNLEDNSVEEITEQLYGILSNKNEMNYFDEL